MYEPSGLTTTVPWAVPLPSVKVFGSKSYLRFYRQGGDGRRVMIPLDMASVTPSLAAMSRVSLRRRVAELEAELAEVLAATGPTQC